MNFIKLKNQFVFDMESFVVDESATFLAHGSVSYYEVVLPEDINNKILSVIPIQFHKFFSVFYLSGGGKLSPHTDQTSQCTLLFYTNPGNFRTEFYELINPNPETIKSIPTSINTDVRQLLAEEYWPHVYKNSDLKLIDSYVAKPHEAWLLNGQTIHAVEPVDDSSIHLRSAIGLDTRDLSFDTVVNLLKQTNSI